MTTRDSVNRFSKVFDKWRHKYDPYSLFERFMEWVIAGFDQTGSKIKRPFDNEESTACMEVFREWIMIMNDELKNREWFDLLGETYMIYMSGQMKKHWTGQYFTPMHITDFMAKIVDAGENSGETVMDNACGSGRMLLAAHANHPTNYCCAQDLDRICCLMTVCNFIVHGVNGEVVWGDGLDPTDYREGWRVNELLGEIGIPCVREMENMESMSFRNGITMLEKQKETNPAPASPKKVKAQKPQLLQPSLFDDIM